MKVGGAARSAGGACREDAMLPSITPAATRAALGGVEGFRDHDRKSSGMATGGLGEGSAIDPVERASISKKAMPHVPSLANVMPKQVESEPA